MNKAAIISPTNELKDCLRRWKKEAMEHKRYFNDTEGIRILEELCQKGADFKYLDNEQCFGCVTHVFFSQKLITFFVERGLNLNSRDVNGDTVLHLAIRHAKYEKDENSADRIVGGRHGHDRMNDYFAICHPEYNVNRHPTTKNTNPVNKVIAFLLDQPAINLESTNLRGETPLLTLANYKSRSQCWDKIQFNLMKVAKMLMERGANVKAVNGDGDSVLHLCIGFIQEFKGNIDIRTSIWQYSMTPLMIDARDGTCQYSLLVESLVESGASVNVVDLQDYTALHHAVLNEKDDSAEFLIERGAADPNLKSRNGRDAYDLGICPQPYNKSSNRVFIFGAPPRKQVELYEIAGAARILKKNKLNFPLTLWNKARGICQKFDLQPTQEFSANYEFLTQNQHNFHTNEEIYESAMHTVVRLSEGSFKKFWNLLAFTPGPNYLLSFFRIFNFLSDDLKRVENFASLEELDFNSLSQVVECFKIHFGSKNKITQVRISHFHSIARLSIACFNKLTHATTSKKVPDTCIKLYVTLCRLLTSLQFQFSDVIPQKAKALSENKGLLSKLIDLDLRDGDSNSLMHLLIRNDCATFNIELIGALLDDSEVVINVKTKNRMGFEPVQMIEEPINEQFLKVLVKLADRGAHIDARNATWNQPTIRGVFEKKERSDLKFRYDNLQCACARIIATSTVPYANRVPKLIVDIIKEHIQ